MSSDNAVVEVEAVGSSAALEALNKSEVDVQIATAHKYPRSLKRTREKILEIATLDPQTAEACFYAIPREGKVIKGPSVRLAEIVAASYGNLRVGARVIGYDETSVICQGACHDLENNVATQVEVRRRITNKRGKKYSDDMVNTTSNAGCSIAFRNAIFKVVPQALFKDIINEVEKVGMGDGRTITESRKACLSWFKGQGYGADQVFALVNTFSDEEVKVAAAEQLTIEHISTLRGIVTAVTEGTSTIEDVFSVVQGEASPTQKALSKEIDKKRKKQQKKDKAEAKGKKEKKAAAPAPEPDQEPSPEPEDTKPARDLQADYRVLYDIHAEDDEAALLIDNLLNKNGMHPLPQIVSQDINLESADKLARVLAEYREEME